jgi:hypothetical protein
MTDRGGVTPPSARTARRRSTGPVSVEQLRLEQNHPITESAIPEAGKTYIITHKTSDQVFALDKGKLVLVNREYGGQPCGS